METVERRGSKSSGMVGKLTLAEVLNSLASGERTIPVAKRAGVTHQRISQVWQKYGTGTTLLEKWQKECERKRIKVECCVCKEQELVHRQRASIYKTCGSKDCMRENAKLIREAIAKAQGAHDLQDWFYQERCKGRTWFDIGIEAGMKGNRNSVNVQSIKNGRKAAKRHNWPWPVKI